MCQSPLKLYEDQHSSDVMWVECVQSQNLYAEALTPNMMVLGGGGALGFQLDLHEIVRG